MSSEDEFDAYPDEYAGLDFDTIPDLNDNILPIQTPEVESDVPPRPTSAGSSSHYSFDDLDQSLLVELDELEGRLTQAQTSSTNGSNGPSSPNVGPSAPTFLAVPPPITLSDTQGLLTQNIRANATGSRNSPILNLATPISAHLVPLSRLFGLPDPPTPGPQYPHEPSSSKSITCHKSVDTDVPPKVPSKRGHTETSLTKSPSSIKKGKGKGNATSGSNNEVRQILEAFEDEMSCPICCDIFVAAHLGNPCGHSFCGECGEAWIAKMKRSPTCAVCRAKLSRSTPMIPNFALDNTVNQHLLALASSGQVEWQPGGSRIKEWNNRKENWKKEAARKAAEKAGAKKSTKSRIHIQIDEERWIIPDDEGDGDYEFEEQLDNILGGRPVTRSRAVR